MLFAMWFVMVAETTGTSSAATMFNAAISHPRNDLQSVVSSRPGKTRWPSAQTSLKTTSTRVKSPTRWSKPSTSALCRTHDHQLVAGASAMGVAVLARVAVARRHQRRPRRAPLVSPIRCKPPWVTSAQTHSTAKGGAVAAPVVEAVAGAGVGALAGAGAVADAAAEGRILIRPEVPAESGANRAVERQCSVSLFLEHKTVPFGSWPRCKSSRYQSVSLWFAPCPDPKCIAFICSIKSKTLH